MNYDLMIAFVKIINSLPSLVWPQSLCSCVQMDYSLVLWRCNPYLGQECSHFYLLPTDHSVSLHVSCPQWNPVSPECIPQSVARNVPCMTCSCTMQQCSIVIYMMFVLAEWQVIISHRNYIHKVILLLHKTTSHAVITNDN